MTSQSLKPGWKMVKFGEVVKNAKLVDRDPEANGVERIVGLEHIYPDNLHILRWNSVPDGTSFTRKFVPGQTLFGKRRAYQRKVAYAEFEGICSGDILTFESKNRKVLLPELLPFICQSDEFFDYALGTSAGSLSPRTSWTALKDFEFPLPPLDEQKRIAEILWAVDEAVEKFTAAKSQLSRLKEVSEIEFFSDSLGSSINLNSKNIPSVSGWVIDAGEKLLKKNYLYKIQDGNHGGQYPRSHEFSKDGLNYLSANNISDEGVIDFDSCPKLPIERANKLRIKPAIGGDVILTHNATVGRVTVIPDDYDEVVLSTSTTYYRLNPDFIDRDYFVGYLRSHYFQRQLHRVMKQSTRDQVPITAQKKLLFIIPPPDKQAEFSKLVGSFQDRLKLLDDHISHSKSLHKTILNESLRTANV